MHRNEIEKILDVVIEKIENNSFSKKNESFTEDYFNLKKISIVKLEKKEKLAGEWIEAVKKVYTKDYLPLETYLALVKVLNEEDRYLQEKANVSKIYKLNDYVLEKVFSEILLNYSPALIMNIINKLTVSTSLEYKKKLFRNKINQSKFLKINGIDKDVTVVVRFSNINKSEVINYYHELKNYCVLPNEEIEMYDIYTGDKYEFKYNNKINYVKSSYINLCDLLIGSKGEFNIQNQYERILLYFVVKELYMDNSQLIRDDIIEIILKNEDLFSNKYIDAIREKTNNKSIKKYVELLKDNPSNKGLKELFEKCNDVNIIFEILKIASSIIDEEIEIETYIQAILKCNRLDKNNIKVALFCEELIKKNPIIIDGIVDFLKSMYKEQVYTNNTLEVLNYLRCTIKDSEILDETLVRINAKNNILDDDFYDKFYKVYENTRNHSLLDEIINKIINSNNLKFDNRIIPIIYDFYKRNNDLNSLNILCVKLLENMYPIRETLITSDDIINLVNHCEKYKIEGQSLYLLKLINEFSESEDLLEKSKSIIEGIYLSGDEKNVRIINKNYYNLIKQLRNESRVILENYINIIVKYGTKYIKNNIEVLDEIEKEITEDVNHLEKVVKVKLLALIIDYYIEVSEYDKAIRYIEQYMQEYKDIDNCRLFKTLLVRNNKNNELISRILMQIDFAKIEGLDILLNMVYKSLSDNNKYDYILQILEYYIKNEKYVESVEVVTEYLKSDEFIGDFTYDEYLMKIFSNLPEEQRIDIYNLMIKREDFPIEMREKFFDLNSGEDNTKKIIDSFVNNESKSALAKELALKHYYSDNDMFSKLANKGENNNAIYAILAEKVKEVFKNDKFYVSKLLEKVAAEEQGLSELKLLADNVLENEFFLENRIVFGEYKTIEKVTGELIDQLRMENIFDGNIIEVLLFKEPYVYKVFSKYFKDKKIKFNIIESEFNFDAIYLDESNNEEFIKGEDVLLKLLINYRELIKLQMDLKDNKVMMLEFLEDSFNINEKAFIPNTYKYISEYENEFIFKELKVFDPSLKKIRKGKKVFVNEQNIVIVMQNYLKIVLDKIDIVNDNKILRMKIMDQLCNNKEINTLEKFIESFNIFIEAENMIFEKINYNQKVKNYSNLSEDDKLTVINMIITRKDSTIRAKKIIISYIEDEKVKEDIANDIINKNILFNYLIQCFNEFTDGFEKDDYNIIYDMIINLLSQLDKEIIEEADSDITTFIIDAKNKTNYRKRDIIKDVEKMVLSEESKKYVLSKLA